MVTEIIVLHQELVLADGLAHIGHDAPSLGPSMHAVTVVVPLVPVELQLPLAVTPRLDAELLVRVAEPLLVHGLRAVVVRELAAGHAPAVLRQVLPARVPRLDVHGGRRGPADPVDGVGVAELVGVVFEVHVGGDLGARVGVEVVGGAGAGGLAQGVEVRGPPDRVPDLEVLEPVAVVDGPGVGRVPGLVVDVVAFGVSEDVGFNADGSFDGSGVVEDGDAVEDTDGTEGWVCDFGGRGDGDYWTGGWDSIKQDVLRESLGRNKWRKKCDERSVDGDGISKGCDVSHADSRCHRRHGDHGGGRGSVHCGGFIE